MSLQSRALEAVVVAHKRYRKSWLLNFVTFTVETDPPMAAPTLEPLTPHRGVNGFLQHWHRPGSLALCRAGCATARRTS